MMGAAVADLSKCVWPTTKLSRWIRSIPGFWCFSSLFCQYWYFSFVSYVKQVQVFRSRSLRFSPIYQKIKIKINKEIHESKISVSVSIKTVKIFSDSSYIDLKNFSNNYHLKNDARTFLREIRKVLRFLVYRRGRPPLRGRIILKGVIDGSKKLEHEMNCKGTTSN